jgi:hypothetical protein
MAIGSEGIARRRKVIPSSQMTCRPHRWPLITPALFSHRPPPDREKREWFVAGKDDLLMRASFVDRI